MTEQAGKVMGFLRALNTCYSEGSREFAELPPWTVEKNY